MQAGYDRETLSEQAGSGHLLQELETYWGSQQGELAVCRHGLCAVQGKLAGPVLCPVSQLVDTSRVPVEKKE